jgi:hypothetical protein
MNIYVKIGTHSLECVKVCRKRTLPKIGEVISIKKLHHGAKEERLKIDSVNNAGFYFAEYM